MNKKYIFTKRKIYFTIRIFQSDDPQHFLWCIQLNFTQIFTHLRGKALCRISKSVFPLLRSVNQYSSKYFKINIDAEYLSQFVAMASDNDDLGHNLQFPCTVHFACYFRQTNLQVERNFLLLVL